MRAEAGETTIRELIDDGELSAAFSVMRELRAQLSEAVFRDRLTRQRERGYVLVAAFAECGEMCGVMGMRPVTTLARGDHLHVDDLVVTKALRGRAIGRRLLEYAEAWAVEHGLVSVFLDSRPEVVEFYGRLGYVPHTATLMRKPVRGDAER